MLLVLDGDWVIGMTAIISKRVGYLKLDSLEQGEIRFAICIISGFSESK